MVVGGLGAGGWGVRRITRLEDLAGETSFEWEKRCWGGLGSRVCRLSFRRVDLRVDFLLLNSWWKRTAGLMRLCL